MQLHDYQLLNDFLKIQECEEANWYTLLAHLGHVMDGILRCQQGSVQRVFW